MTALELAAGGRSVVSWSGQLIEIRRRPRDKWMREKSGGEEM